MTLNSIIIDDEPIGRKILKEFINDIDFLSFKGEAENPLLALSLLTQDKIDLIFLDINMPVMNGIDFLKNAKTDAKIIITTAYPEYAVEAFGLDVIDYLLKPISFERFLKASNKAKDLVVDKKPIQNQSEKKHDHFFIKCDNQIEKVFYDDLLYAEAMLNYVMLITMQKKLLVYITIKSLEEQLPSETFIKIHKSFIVNMNKVQSIEGNILEIVGGSKITTSQNLHEKVIRTILEDKMIKR